MEKIVIYTKTFCPYCVRAKMRMKKEGWDFEEKLLSSASEFEELVKMTGMMTVPQIFVGEIFIGGSDDLERRLEEVRELMK